MIKKKIFNKENIDILTKDFPGIIVGTFIAAIGISLYLVPHRISPGGVGGLAQILHVLFHWKTGLTMLLFNVPLFILGFIIIGKIFGAKTVFGMIAISVFVDLLEPNVGYIAKIFSNIIMEIPKYPGFYSLTDDTFLACIAGNVFLGIGIGIVFRFRGSTAGTDIPAAVIRKYTGFSLGVGFMLIDSIIIIFSGIVFKDPNLIIWAMFGLFISSKMCDFVMEGLPIAKTAMITSDKYHDIITVISEKLGRGATLIKAEGGYTNLDKPVLFCVISRKEVFQLKKIVKEIDPKAFIVLHDTHDVLGQGFRPLKNIDLSGL